MNTKQAMMNCLALQGHLQRLSRENPSSSNLATCVHFAKAVCNLHTVIVMKYGSDEQTREILPKKVEFIEALNALEARLQRYTLPMWPVAEYEHWFKAVIIALSRMSSVIRRNQKYGDHLPDDVCEALQVTNTPRVFGKRRKPGLVEPSQPVFQEVEAPRAAPEPTILANIVAIDEPAGETASPRLPQRPLAPSHDSEHIGRSGRSRGEFWS